MSEGSSYPVIDSVPTERLCEKLVAEHFFRHQGQIDITVRLGSDAEGVPDCFGFQDEVLLAAVEVTGYVLGEIQDIRRVTQLAPNHFSIDAGGSFRVHERQPHPKTLIKKKILGERAYKKFDAKKLILLVHSDVLVREGELIFAMLGLMNMSPSCDHFTHHRGAILEELRAIVATESSLKWDEIWLIDYTQYTVAEMAVFHRLWPKMA
jgi:hypothetical protein